MTSVDYAAVRAAISIDLVLELIDFTPTERRGVQLRGPCPIHGSQSARSRSFSVNLDKNAFRCFGCGAQGNQLDLWAKVHQLSLAQAACELCTRANVPLPRRSPPGGFHFHSAGTEKRNP